MKTIAVGIDFSPESTVAARQAVRIAHHVGAVVVLVHSELFVELPQVGPEPEAQVQVALDTYRALLARELEESRKRLTELRRSLSGQGPEVSQTLVEGATDEALCAAARALEADLLAAASRRSGPRIPPPA